VIPTKINFDKISAWIASAALEGFVNIFPMQPATVIYLNPSISANVGKLEMARVLIMEGCAKNPKAEDLWLEAVRLHPPPKAKNIVANAILDGACPHSVRIWLKAAELELKVFETFDL
jgi:hypothetical protein